MLFRTTWGGPNDAKAKGKFISRKKHFVNWCKSAGVDTIFRKVVVNDINHVMALYALYLAQGETLLCRSIKANTIERYFHAAAKLSTTAHQMDPILDT